VGLILVEQCQEINVTEKGATCPDPNKTAIIAGATAFGGFAVVVLCVYIFFQKKNSKPSSVMRRTNRSTTLEESAPQPPVAVEPGNTGVSNSITNGGIEEDGTVHWWLREAFEILDRDQKKNLEKRLENVRR
jgi:hypothetical protein